MSDYTLGAGVLPNDLYERFRSLIYAESGIHFMESNRCTLEGRVHGRMLELKLSNPDSYFAKLISEKTELLIFLDAVTTNLTRFFRNTAQYVTLEKFVVPDLVKHINERRRVRHIRLWSAGCSTGEEPYTNAMCLKEWLPSGFTFEVVASDLSLKSLETAKAGIYGAERCNDIPDLFLRKYFINRHDGSYEVGEFLRKSVIFDYHNLKFKNDRTDFDIVFCRNVIIYFDEESQKNTMSKLYDAMTGRSYLFLGHSESLFGLNTKFEFVRTPYASLYGKLLD